METKVQRGLNGAWSDVYRVRRQDICLRDKPTILRGVVICGTLLVGSTNLYGM